MAELSYEYTAQELTQIIDVCMRALRSKDTYTFQHSERVGYYAERIATAMDLSEADVAASRMLGRLHDIGKLFVPKEILLKPRSLNEREWETMRRHSIDSARILSCMSFVEEYINVVLSLHERYDGRGYPQRLEGGEIPMLARILAVADSYDAMVTDRPYRRAQSFDYVCSELLHGRGAQFCPEVVDHTLALMEQQIIKPAPRFALARDETVSKPSNGNGSHETNRDS